MKWRQKTTEMRTVLFVDDDEVVLRSIERGFWEEPYNKLFRNSGKEALETLQREEVHVIVADRRMPEMDGFELLKTIRKKYPNIVGILLSGYTEMDTVRKAVNQGEIFRFIPKPWKLGEDFIKVVREAIEHYNLQSERGQSGGRKREKCIV